MKSCMIWISALVLFSLVIHLLPGPAAPIRQGKPPPPSKLELARLNAAREACSRFSLHTRVGGSLVDVLEMNYLWSKRLLEAEREVGRNKMHEATAFKAHLDRMVELETKIKKRLWEQSKGVKLPSRHHQLQERAAAVFYRAEAELWLEKAKLQR